MIVSLLNKNEQRFACSPNNKASVSEVLDTSHAAKIILIKQQEKDKEKKQKQQKPPNIKDREISRCELSQLGGAYSLLCRGAPLSLWCIDDNNNNKSNTPSFLLNSVKEHQTLQNKKEENKRIIKRRKSVQEAPQIKQEECNLQSSIEKSAAQQITKKEIEESESSLNSTPAAQTTKVLNSTLENNLTPEFTQNTNSLLSQAELSAVEILANDMDNIGPMFWRASQEELSPGAIYSDDNNNKNSIYHSPAAWRSNRHPTNTKILLSNNNNNNNNNNSSNMKRKRTREENSMMKLTEIENPTARCLYFDTEDIFKPSRPSMSGMVLERYNEKTQQQLTMQCLMLPY